MNMSIARNVVFMVAPHDNVKQQTRWIVRNTRWQNIKQCGIRMNGWFAGIVWARAAVVARVKEEKRHV